MWILVDKYDKNMFCGKLNSDPIHIKNLKCNDSVKLKKEDVEDWMIVNNNDADNFKGGFTIRPILNKK